LYKNKLNGGIKGGIKMKHIRKVFLENLPIGGLNRGNRIDWTASVGYKVRFIYDDIEGWIEIVSYNLVNSIITIKYNDKEHKINTDNFKKCKLGKLLGRHTNEFKIELGTRFQDDKRDITITGSNKIKDEKTGQWCKYYKYKCNKCGYDCGEHYSIKDKKHKGELWVVESQLELGCGCSVCCSAPKIVVKSINSIVATDKWMIPIVGEEVAKTHTYNSSDKIKVTCPDCGRVKSKKMDISTIHQCHSISCSCSDKTPYTEKLIFNILEQLGVNFEYHKTFEWSKSVQVENIELCGRKEYDFYLIDYNIMIEAHGIQHYEESNRGRSLKIEQANDEIKKELALDNGIKEENYIVVDCRTSELEWIKQNILNSRLSELFNLSQIDWIKTEEFALSNLIKAVCDIWNNKEESEAIIDISEKTGYGRTTIRRWLNKGSNYGFTNYNGIEEKIKGNIKNSGKIQSKSVEIFKDGISKGIFPSCAELSRQSENLFGVKLNAINIAQVCRNEKKSHKGYTFNFV
jgi:hypothetical protein